MIKELSKDDDNWREIAYKICRNKDLANDLVNDMYIKMHDTCKRSYSEISVTYVWSVLRNLYIKYLKDSQKTISLEDFYNIEDLKDNCEVLEDRIMINDALTKLELWDREILLHTSETSLRKLSKETKIPVYVLHYSKQVALKKLKDNL